MLSARQQYCLKAIGIDRWLLRSSAEPVTAEESQLSKAAPRVVASTEISAKAGVSSISRTDSAMPASSQSHIADPIAEPVGETTPSVIPVTRPPLHNWEVLIQSIQDCRACDLAQNCNRKVPGTGNRQADLMIIGEGPGHDEDIQGEPFVGRSGQLLDKMLAAIGIAREQVYITNIVKCRPPDNRDPHQQEAQHCRAYLDAQIKLVRPRIILSVGRVSAHNLLDTKIPVGKLIRQMHQLPGSEIPVKVTYHPAYLLRTPSAKAIVWQDLKQLHQFLNP